MQSRGCLGSETALYDTVTVGTCHHTHDQTHRMSTTKSELSFNYGLWVMCQCRFSNRYKRALWWDGGDGGGGACGDRVYVENLCNFCLILL